MVSNIKCTVEECQYNESDLCQASTIKVQAGMQDHVISTSHDTACRTFTPKTNLS
ncbi:protein of unknown function [Selenihalanaerobacter shriftii]|uniref:DUF1540 domain-containing protein n=1 Tax=Selenihalanaerobacter shriftii TaxID=142842 RepID=A0A1T4NVR9_9FIRM|nr:protein of unknown function [Selenihalanaerobacter shriftii]